MQGKNYTTIEYSISLGFDLAFQNFDQEVAGLPGDYTPPIGRLLLGLHDKELAGCVALRKIEPLVCEMKRLRVRPRFRNMQIGRSLAAAIINEARQIGYARMRLDTVPSMDKARSPCRALGFKEIPAYRHKPIEVAIFMELHLL
jgi:GNAT superfamily N-acetyltransferase